MAMNGNVFYRIIADIVLITHAAFVVFVIFGLVLIIYGGFRRWHWIKNPWFRLGHLAAIGVVVLQAWFGMICPLTTLEMALRERAGEVTYSGSFVAHWVQRMLFYEAPTWVFALCYTLFGLLVIASWIAFRPRPLRLAAKQ